MYLRGDGELVWDEADDFFTGFEKNDTNSRYIRNFVDTVNYHYCIR